MALALAPPAKRRRLSPPTDDESDDDELSFQPEEVSARRDPEYQISVHRAQAEHKLQSKMESIFDKYSRDFEGIGDEIDMETGEIVVNNGHLSHLSDEDEDDILSGRRHSGGGDEDEEDRIMKGHAPNPHSTALVPVYGNGPPGYGSSMPGFFPQQFGRSPLDFGPPPLPFDASPFGFGASPLAMGPWDIPGDFGNTPRSEIGFGSGYDFPIRDNSMALAAPRTKTRTILGPWRKTILASARSRGATNEDDDDETILTGKAVGVNEITEVSDEDDDLLLAGAHKPATKRLALTGGVNSGHAMGTTRRKRRSSAEQISSGAVATKTPSSLVTNLSRTKRPQTQLVATKVRKLPALEDDPDLSDRRRSGRMRKQVEYMGKISWSDALAERRSTRTVVEMPSSDPGRDDGYDRVDEAIGSEVPSSPERHSREIPARERSDADKHFKRRLVPDSQDSATPPASSASRQAEAEGDPKPESRFERNDDPQNDIDSGCFSDEEIPAFQHPAKEAKGARRNLVTESRRQSLHKTSVPEPTDVVEDTDAEESSDGEVLEADGDHHSPGRPVETTSEGKPLRMVRELRRLQKLTASSPEMQKALAHMKDDSSETDASKKQLRSTRSKRTLKAAAEEESSMEVEEETALPAEDEEIENQSAPLPADDDPYSLPEDPTPVLPPAVIPSPTRHSHSSPNKDQDKDTPKHTPSKPTPRKSSTSPSKPQTPRHATLPSNLKAPSSRRSVLSLLSDDDEDGVGDELGRAAPSSAGAPRTSKKLWKPTPRTTEVYHTPVKKRRREPVSPGSVVKTPGGTVRTCGVDGYRCGRDFCFTCL